MTRPLPTALAGSLIALACAACQPAGQQGDEHPSELQPGDAMQAEAAVAATGEVVQTADTVQIASPWVRATAPNAPAAGGFLILHNTGDTADRLLSASTDAAGEVQIHEAGMDGGVMRMRELADGLEIPAGETVELEPGGYHLMLMAPPAPLVAGDTVQMQLVFERAGTVDVTFPVRPLDATTASDDQHGGH